MVALPADSEQLERTCCIVGGGPAGMMLGVLLARAQVNVVVLEKHADFLRDFRGDTIHPSTLAVMHELGLLDALLKLPHRKLSRFTAQFGDTSVVVADVSRLATRCPFIALMPQWDFLTLLAEHGRGFPAFQLRMQAEVTGLVERDGRVLGVRANTPAGALEVRAQLVVGADGRTSTVRACSRLTVLDIAAPMDALWFRVARKADDPVATFRADFGQILVMIDRGDYWQIAYVIRKGSEDEIRSQGLDVLRSRIIQVAPFLADRMGEMRDWNDVRLLSVKMDRLREWYRPGLLCIGDAAHAMSPVGGVGINLAIQDAVAAANLLARPLREGTLAVADLAGVQRRRERPTRLTQRFQVFLHDRIVVRALRTPGPLTLSRLQRLLLGSPFLSRLRGRIGGMGFRAEHIEEIRDR